MTQAMTKPATAIPPAQHSLVIRMAERYEIAPEKFMGTLIKTVFPAGKEIATEQAAAFLIVANEYKLNPFIKEIYAFPGKSGGIIPVVSIDGWLTIINRQRQLDGIEFTDRVENGKLVAVTAKIYRKDRSRPTEVTEYMSECFRKTDTWERWPNRMLRHKALIQAARYAFGLSGIYEPDEAERIAEASGDTLKQEGREIIPVITEPQRMALVEAARKSGQSIGKIVQSAGYTLLADVPLARFEELLALASLPLDIPTPEPEPAAPEPEDEEIIDGEVPEEEGDDDRPDDSLLEDLRAGVEELLQTKFSTAADRKKFLAGRVIGMLEPKELGEMFHELLKM